MVLFLILQTALGFQIGYVFCYTNQLTPALNAKYDWDTPSEQSYYESIVGASGVGTTIVGTAMGGKLIKYGRRRTLIIQGWIGVVGILITLYPGFYTIVLGRLFYGLSVGILAIATPRLMEESIPPHLVGFFSACYCLSFAVAAVLANAVAGILPPDTDI